MVSCGLSFHIFMDPNSTSNHSASCHGSTMYYIIFNLLNADAKSFMDLEDAKHLIIPIENS